MDITPVNMQMVYHTANEATNVQHNLNHAVNVQQEFEAMKQKQEDELKQKQVRNKDNPEDGKIKEDNERQGRGGGYKRNVRNMKQQSQGEQEKFAVDPSRGHHLDISL